MNRDEQRALVAKVERETGLDVVTVEEVEIRPLANGTCHWCGAPIQYIFLAWCDACMDDPSRRVK